jgi:hypothetical protein
MNNRIGLAWDYLKVSDNEWDKNQAMYKTFEVTQDILEIIKLNNIISGKYSNSNIKRVAADTISLRSYVRPSEADELDNSRR